MVAISSSMGAVEEEWGVEVGILFGTANTSARVLDFNAKICSSDGAGARWLQLNDGMRCIDGSHPLKAGDGTHGRWRLAFIAFDWVEGSLQLHR